MKKDIFNWLLVLMCLLIAGCKAVVYSNLNEKDANEIIYVLFSNGITAERRLVDETYSVLVENDRLPFAISTLKINGLPKAKFASIGEMFGGEELVRTPFHEHARFIHAISQELAKSISEIEGVMTARVHIMLPEKSAISKKRIEQSSAAVFVYTDNLTLRNSLPPIIKTLISHSVDGLDYDGVAVAIFDNQENATDNIKHDTEFENLKNLKDKNGTNISGLMAVGKAKANVLDQKTFGMNSATSNFHVTFKERIIVFCLLFLIITLGAYLLIIKARNFYQK